MNKTVQIALLSALLAFVAGFGSGYVARPYIAGGGIVAPAQPAAPSLVDPTTTELEPIRPPEGPAAQDEPVTVPDPAGEAPAAPQPANGEPTRPPGVPASQNDDAAASDPVDAPPR